MRHSMAWPANVMSLCAYFSVGAGGDADLFLHEVEPGEHFGHRMLDLKPRVHLDEIELAVLVEKLDRADALVAEIAHGLRDAAADLVALDGVEGRGMGLFPDLLVAALQRTIALAQMHRAALAVAQDLDFDVARLLEIFLDIDFVIAEGGLGFRLRGAKAISSSASMRATFMPRPPPPAVALMITG